MARSATLWLRVVSMASAMVIAGKMVVSRRASIDFPAPGGPITLINTLLGNDTDDESNCLGGSVASLGYNLATDSSCGLTAGSDQQNVDPLLGPFTDDDTPGRDSNPINPKSHGVIPVAILTTATLDATTVDPLSVQFSPQGAREAHNKGHFKDVNRDGQLDLVLHFNTRATVITCGDTSASLTGETLTASRSRALIRSIRWGVRRRGGVEPVGHEVGLSGQAQCWLPVDRLIPFPIGVLRCIRRAGDRPEAKTEANLTSPTAVSQPRPVIMRDSHHPGKSE